MKHDFLTVIASGTLTKDLKTIEGYTDSVGLSGNAVFEKYFTDMDGTPKRSTNFMDFIYWCKSEVAQTLDLKKGDRIYLEGEIIQKSWKEEGKNRYKHELKLKSLKKA